MAGASPIWTSRDWRHCCVRFRDLEEVETWTTGDLRPGREAERWLNTLLRRTEAAWASS